MKINRLFRWVLLFAAGMLVGMAAAVAFHTLPRWHEMFWTSALAAETMLASETEPSPQIKTYTFPADEIPAELTQTAMQVLEGDTVICLTFAGDSTLGGEVGMASNPQSFPSYVERHGMDYPFAQLQTLFAEDDLTIMNLEGVLSDDTSGKVPGKEYNFIGQTAYTAILAGGSVECVNLANNHTQDYGQRGYQDTINALNDAGIAHFGEDTVTVLEKNGVRIGFTGSLFAMSGGRQQALQRQIAALQSVGCQWIAHTLHAGEEYAAQPTGKQRSAAAYAAEQGAFLVVGHHPHVVQGMETLGGIPVLYSLGNCSFGGNSRPRDYDALLLSVQLHFTNGLLSTMQLTLHPIRISGEMRYNNYQPVLLRGTEAVRVMEKLQKSSEVELAPYQEGKGAVQPILTYQKQEE